MCWTPSSLNCTPNAPSLADLLDLLAVPAIAARFGLEDADRMRVQDWLENAGARWGLDAADRTRHGADGIAQRTALFSPGAPVAGTAERSGQAAAGQANPASGHKGQRRATPVF